MTAGFLAYLVGGAGTLVEWRAYLLRCGQEFRKWSALGAVLWAVQYALLGAGTAAATMAATAFRTLLSARRAGDNFRHMAPAVFLLLFGALTAASWQGAVSLLPLFAVSNTTLALFYLENRPMRMALLLSSAAWIANDVIWQAWPALLAETGAAALNLRTLSRLSAVHSASRA